MITEMSPCSVESIKRTLDIYTCHSSVTMTPESDRTVLASSLCCVSGSLILCSAWSRPRSRAWLVLYSRVTVEPPSLSVLRSTSLLLPSSLEMVLE